MVNNISAFNILTVIKLIITTISIFTKSQFINADAPIIIKWWATSELIATSSLRGTLSLEYSLDVAVIFKPSTDLKT